MFSYGVLVLFPPQAGFGEFLLKPSLFVMRRSEQPKRLSGQRYPFEMAVPDEGMEVVFDLTCDGWGADMQTEFNVSHLRRLGEVGGRHQCFTPINHNTFGMQRTAHLSSRC